LINNAKSAKLGHKFKFELQLLTNFGHDMVSVSYCYRLHRPFRRRPKGLCVHFL